MISDLSHAQRRGEGILWRKRKKVDISKEKGLTNTSRKSAGRRLILVLLSRKVE
jgi:hypothetical protein